jgi:dTDP-4-amino-4,6-dideoxygalactose transaminase
MSLIVPFFSFTKAPQSLQQEWQEAINKVIKKGIFILGDQVCEFETRWNKSVGTSYALGTSNGQDALILALRALGINKGKKVVVPAHSFIATHNAVVALGAEIVSIDVNENGLLDENLLREIREPIDVLIAVHMHGRMCNMPSIRSWAKENQVAIVEDCSQAHNAEFQRIKAGNWGDIGIFSLYPTKNLGALGDAGVIVTNDENLFGIMSKISNYGTSRGNKYEHLAFGLNHRLDEIQAAVLNVNLKYLIEWNARRKKIADIYLKEINHPEIEFLNSDVSNNVWHHFCILVNDRDQIRNKLLDHDVYTEVHYPFVSSNEVEKYQLKPIKVYPNAKKIASKTLSLPISPWHSDEEIYKVVSLLNK